MTSTRLFVSLSLPADVRGGDKEETQGDESREPTFIEMKHVNIDMSLSLKLNSALFVMPDVTVLMTCFIFRSCMMRYSTCFIFRTSVMRYSTCFNHIYKQGNDEEQKV